MDGTTWWRMFASLLHIRKRTPMSIVHGICKVLAPCHKAWGMGFQKPYDNDNRRNFDL